MTEADETGQGPQRSIRWIESQRAFVTRLLESSVDEISAFLRKKAQFECLSAPMRKKVTWIIDSFTKTNELPKIDSLNLQFPGFCEETLVLLGDRAEYDAAKPTLESAWRQVREMYQAKLISTKTNEIVRLWDDPTKTMADIIELEREMSADLTAFQVDDDDKTKTLRESVDDILYDVAEAAAGRRWGIPFPFPFVQHATMGAEPGDITTIIGRPGIGKTFAVLMCIVSAITGNPYFFTQFERARVPARFELTKDKLRELMRVWRTRVMVLSLEMPVEVIRMRLAALITRIGFPELRSGKFSPGNEDVFKKKMANLAKPGEIGDSCLIVDRVTTPAQIFAAAMSFKARMVVVDGFYLMAAENEKRWETVQRNMALFRAHAKLTGIHYLLVSQLDTQTDRVMFSQAITQDSANIIFLKQTNAEKIANEIHITTQKIRNGVSMEDYQFNWNIEAGRFDELRPAPQTTPGGRR